MRIAITGTRGIPNRYGGFERFAEKLSVGLAAKNHEVWVYNSTFHPHKGEYFMGVKILRKISPERRIGAGGNYLYDLLCLKDAIRRKPDVILECGYASASPWYPVLRRKGVKLVTHMDGMEWQREKWGRLTRVMFHRAERTAVKNSDLMVCDHPEIAGYYQEKYSRRPEMISYGAEIRENRDESVPEVHGLEPGAYYLLLARLEPENNIRMIIEGFLASGVREPLVLIGDHSGKYGRYIFREFGNNERLRFLGGIFDQEHLDHIRHFSKAVLHGHSAGGTNPSLLEAMAAGAFIIAHNNPYNKWILGNNAAYFGSSEEVSSLLSGINGPDQDRGKMISNNIARIRKEFQWKSVIQQYEKLFTNLTGSGE